MRASRRSCCCRRPAASAVSPRKGGRAIRRLVLPGAVALLAAACSETPPATAPARAPSPTFSVGAASGIIPGQYIVVLREPAGDVAAVARSLLARHGGALRRTYTRALRGFSAQMSAEAAAAVAAEPRVAYVEPNQVARAITEQADATWGLDRVDQRDLPLSTTYVYNVTGAGVTAYIIDTGIRITHQEFGGRASIGTDEVWDGFNGDDCHGHGTHVAGTVGGATYGVAKAVALIAVRVLDCDGSGTYEGVIAGVDWVTAHHQDGQPAVANMSLAGGFSQALNEAVANSVADGITYAVAAANDYWDACQYSPASEPSAITVGATDATDTEADFSNRGSCVDIWAPGVAITSAWNWSDDATETISGTSMAAPHVAGAAALYLETNIAATAADVDAALTQNATTGKITWNDPFGDKPPAPPAEEDYLLYTGFITGGPLPPPPAAPASLAAAAASHSQIDLTWTDNADNENGFKIDRCQGAGCTNFAHIASVGANSTAYSNTGLSASTTYRYRVRAYNGGGNSQYSNEAEATTLAPPPPPVAPSGLAAAPVSTSQINLAWTDNSTDEDGFRIERCQGAGCTAFAEITTVGPNVTTYNNTGLAAGTLYRYRVRAYNGPGGNSSYSNTAEATTHPPDYAPVARYTWSCGHQKGGRVCAFDGSSSTDDNGITSFSWDFGDGTSATGVTVNKTFPSRGAYFVTLQVRDNSAAGQTNSCSKWVQTGTSGACP
jgi:hypothetical protein